MNDTIYDVFIAFHGDESGSKRHAEFLYNSLCDLHLEKLNRKIRIYFQPALEPNAFDRTPERACASRLFLFVLTSDVPRNEHGFLATVDSKGERKRIYEEIQAFSQCSFYRTNPENSIKACRVNEMDNRSVELLHPVFQGKVVFDYGKQFAKNYKEIIDWITSELIKTEKPATPASTPGQRVLCDYRSIGTEATRLSKQRKFFLEYDCKVLFSLLERMSLTKNSPITVLDVGCNNANFIYDRLGDFPNLTVVGLDADEFAIAEARKNYGDRGFKGFKFDVEKDSFSDLEEIMKSENIPPFDLAVCSMILHHISRNAALKTLIGIRKNLASGGHIFIRDMDDALAVAYPDPHGYMAKLNAISLRLNYFSGHRLSGREDYSLLKKAGFSSIECLPVEVSTVGKNADEREDMHEINFLFILNGVKERAKDNPTKENLEEAQLAEQYYNELFDLFLSQDFYYRMGTMVYIAKK